MTKRKKSKSQDDLETFKGLLEQLEQLPSPVKKTLPYCIQSILDSAKKAYMNDRHKED